MVETSPGARIFLLGLAAVHPHEDVTFLISSGPVPTFLIMKTWFIGGPLSAVPKLYAGSVTSALAAPAAAVPVGCSPSSPAPAEGKSAAKA